MTWSVTCRQEVAVTRQYFHTLFTAVMLFSLPNIPRAEHRMDDVLGSKMRNAKKKIACDEL